MSFFAEDKDDKSLSGDANIPRDSRIVSRFPSKAAAYSAYRQLLVEE